MSVAVVLGMHRSGTSPLARVIGLLGANAGPESDLIPAAKDNPRGFWELRPFVELNERILGALDGTSSSPHGGEIDWASDGRLDPLREDAVAAVDRWLTGPEARVWKDPRTCLTFGFWKPLLPSPVAVVIPVRNPLEVARSLEVRDGIPVEVGLALWERHVTAAVDASRGLPVHIVSFHRLLQDPAAVAAGLCGFLTRAGFTDLAVPNDDALLEFISPAMRHGRFQREDLDRHPAVTNSQRAWFDFLLEWSRGATDAAASGSLPRGSGTVMELYRRSLETSDLRGSVDRLAGRLAELEGVDEARRRTERDRDDYHARLRAIESSFGWKVGRRVESVRRSGAARSLGRVARPLRNRWERGRTANAPWRGTGEFGRERDEALSWWATRAGSPTGDPAVAIVIPCHNDGNFLPNLLLSLKQQRVAPGAIVLVDDGSTETATVKLLDDLAESAGGRDRVLRQPGSGSSAARNRGIEATSAEYIACVDADDALDERYLEETLRALREDPSPGYAYFDYRKFGEVEAHVRPPEFDAAALLRDNYVVVSAPFRRRMWEEAAGFDETLTEGYEDWDFWLRSLRHGWTGVRVPATLFYYRRRTGSQGDRAEKRGETFRTRFRERYADLWERYGAEA